MLRLFDLPSGFVVGYKRRAAKDPPLPPPSPIPDLVVVARSSSFAYKGKAVDIRQIGKDLGVGYVVEGSVRKDGDKLRIVAQLIDAKTGEHVWAERF